MARSQEMVSPICIMAEPSLVFRNFTCHVQLSSTDDIQTNAVRISNKFCNKRNVTKITQQRWDNVVILFLKHIITCWQNFLLHRTWHIYSPWQHFHTNRRGWRVSSNSFCPCGDRTPWGHIPVGTSLEGYRTGYHPRNLVPRSAASCGRGRSHHHHHHHHHRWHHESVGHHRDPDHSCPGVGSGHGCMDHTGRGYWVRSPRTCSEDHRSGVVHVATGHVVLGRQSYLEKKFNDNQMVGLFTRFTSGGVHIS